MARHILYGNRESGHAYKARFALRLLGIEHEYREVDAFLPRHERPEDWRIASRFGEVPVLLVNDRPIVQSNAILLHLARSFGSLGWEVDPDILTEWLFWEANRIAMSLPHIRFHARFPVPIEAEVLQWMYDRLADDLRTLDVALAKSRFLMGDRISAADVSCCAYMFFADQIPLDLTSWTHVSRWLDDIRALAEWQHPYGATAQGIT